MKTGLSLLEKGKHHRPTAHLIILGSTNKPKVAGRGLITQAANNAFACLIYGKDDISLGNASRTSRVALWHAGVITTMLMPKLS
jgi:hypothetical protein